MRRMMIAAISAFVLTREACSRLGLQGNSLEIGRRIGGDEESLPASPSLWQLGALLDPNEASIEAIQVYSASPAIRHGYTMTRESGVSVRDEKTKK